jgi:L-arabinose isomerase
MPAIDLSQREIWFVTGSQHLYGDEALRQVEQHSREVAAALDQSSQIPLRVVFKSVMTSADSIRDVILEANSSPNCAGIIAWMHTFSPAKMWIAGLRNLQKPLLHLHTQLRRDLPWSTIDMDFMNLHQSAHGDREFGYICTRMRLRRKVVVGHWQDDRVHRELGTWSRAAAAWLDAQTAKIARLGDNMRDVAVTEGDKVAAQIDLGFTVNGYGMGDLATLMQQVADRDVDGLCAEYDESYVMASALRSGGERRAALRDAARIELGLRRFLEHGNFVGFTDTFEDLHGLKQLPGIAVQRLMNDGYGFGAEGDWKAAALVRIAKVMASALPGGTSFMEDYTYHFVGDGKTLGAHMLEICPSIAASKPSCEIHPLSIGGKEDPVRLVFTAPPGPAVNATIIDMGDRFRMVLNEVDVVEPDAKLERLPVAHAVWKPRPNLANAAARWIEAGGSHHPVFSQALTAEHFKTLSEIWGVDVVLIS